MLTRTLSGRSRELHLVDGSADALAPDRSHRPAERVDSDVGRSRSTVGASTARRWRDHRGKSGSCTAGRADGDDREGSRVPGSGEPAAPRAVNASPPFVSDGRSSPVVSRTARRRDGPARPGTRHERCRRPGPQPGFIRAKPPGHLRLCMDASLTIPRCYRTVSPRAQHLGPPPVEDLGRNPALHR